MTFPLAPTRKLLVALTAAPLAALLTGCMGIGVSPAPTTATTIPLSAHSVSGTVFGGQQPVSGSSIQLYTLNPTTLRGASTPQLVPGSVLTSATGSFSITASYTCPAADYVYLVATGGDAGSGTNNNLAMMAGLGTCSSISSATRVSINELTTVATAYALAPYMKDLADAGYTATNATGIANAFATMNSLVNMAAGTVPGASAPANATLPITQINTLANLIATCVNTSTTCSTCSTLFGIALNGSTQPANTIDALLNIAHNPGAHTTPLFNLVDAVVPYQPSDTSPPNDFTLAVKLSAPSLATPFGLAIDASGNAWVTNETGNAVTQFSPIGLALTSSGSAYSFNGAQSITIDPSGNLWIANTGGNNIVKLTSAGTLSTSFTNFSINAPTGIAADARGNIWIASFLSTSAEGYNVTELGPTANFMNGLVGGGAFTAPIALALDPSGNVWIANNGSPYLTEYSKTAAQLSTNPGFTDNALQGPAAIATDSLGNIWVAGQGGPELSGFNNNGTSLSTTPLYNASGASLALPTGIAIDGGNTIYIANSTASGYISEFTPATGTPVTNEQSLGAALNAPVQLATDPSGNLWVTSSGDNSVTLFVGLAAPTLTPLVARTQ